MRLVVAAAIAAFWILQAPAPQPVLADREAAYRSNNLGVARLEQFAYDDAARAFREALRLSPGLDIARLNLAIADFYGGRPVEAAAGALASAERMATSPTAHYLVGLIAKADNRLDEAVAAFSRVLQLDAADAATLTFLGQIHLQQRRFADALPLFERAVAAEPFNVTAAYSAALALTRAGRADDGRAAMQRFERLRDSVYSVTYAQTYLAQGRYGEAIASTGAESELVEGATPRVTFEDVTKAWTPGDDGRIGDTGGGTGNVTLFDPDNDGTLDVLLTGHSGTRLLRNEGSRLTDQTSRAGLPPLLTAVGSVTGDFDNDGRADLYFFGGGSASLFRQRADGTYEGMAAPTAPPASATTAAAADIDHDGDLDLLVAGETAQVLRNNGTGAFADITSEAGFRAPLGRPVAIAATDFDNRRDIDVLIAGADSRPALFRNMRDGTFKDVAAEVGLPAPGDYSAVGTGDANKDGYPDFFLGTRNGAGTLALSDGRGRFRLTDGPAGAGRSIAAQFVDYDNDGLLDLLTMSIDGSVHLARNVGGGRWTDVTREANLPEAAKGAGGPQSMAVGDLDNDGDRDVAIRTSTGAVRVLRNSGGSRNMSLRVRLSARVSNRSSVGAKVEIRAGSLRQILETSSSSPAVAPSDVVFGLGARAAADVVRVLWPSGILQAETDTAPARSTRALTITELDRKPSSCPYLFTWNGSRFEFVTDFMGGGEMGGWTGPGSWNHPDPDEYVRIRADQLRARDGRYELRMTNELEEALFVDRLQLVAIDHPDGVDVYPNEGLRQRRSPFALHRVRGARPPVRARDDHGHDVLPQVTALDRRYPDDFRRLPVRGYAETHALELDLGAPAGDAVLLLTGWTDYAFSNDNVAAAQAGLAMIPPSLQVKDVSGAWRTAIADLGFPVGRPQTMAIDLAGIFPAASREVRIVTSMRIYWDQVLVATPDRAAMPRETRLNALAADLRSRGFSAEATPDGREPFGYDYQHVSASSPWKVPAGRYTREGDVRPLLRGLDDMFVISRPGDELALSFDAKALPALTAGWTRTFLLYVHGYSKEMNPRSAVPETVAPLPFRAMTQYPYSPGEHYPRSAAHRRYDELYNTRIVTRTVPTIDVALTAAGVR